MSISATDVRTLRERTGAGMMDCKKALSETNGNMDDAIEILRKQGLASAAKKAGRIATEGIVANHIDEAARVMALAEVNCETDFVVKTADFDQFATTVAKLVADKNPADLNDLLQCKLGDNTVETTQMGLVAKIGENIGTRRFARKTWAANQKCALYIHTGSKIAAALIFDDPNNKLPMDLAKDIAMHVTAMSPQYVRGSEVPADVVAKEKEIQMASMADQKKPAEILEKIAAGKIQKFLSDICLEDQIFVKDPEGKRSVAKILTSIDPSIRITAMTRMQVGEGIEKKQEDFAAEVAKMMQ